MYVLDEVAQMWVRNELDRVRHKRIQYPRSNIQTTDRSRSIFAPKYCDVLMLPLICDALTHCIISLTVKLMQEIHSRIITQQITIPHNMKPMTGDVNNDKHN